LNIAVSDYNVQLTIDTIIKVNQTPAPGDGKIFVLPLDDACRVRTGETGTTIL
jgi:nitrogen regulatory protein PII 2